MDDFVKISEITFDVSNIMVPLVDGYFRSFGEKETTFRVRKTQTGDT